MTKHVFYYSWTTFMPIVLACVLCTTSALRAFAGLESPLIIVDDQHVDLEVGVVNGTWDMFVNAWYDGNLPSNQAILHVNRNTRTVSSAWESWIGAEGGATVWVLDQLSVPGEIWLGFASRECGSIDTWMPDDSRISFPYSYLQIDLVDVRGYDGDNNPNNNPPAPGYLSMWQTESNGSKTPWFSTAETLSDGNRAYSYPGGHAHYNWAFTAEGIYEMDLQPRAYLNGELSVGPLMTFYIGVERPVPGDANLDDQVDETDAGVLTDNWNTSSDQIGWLEGDFNADGTVDAIDASIMAANWGSALSETSNVPEPSIAALLFVGLTLCLSLRKRP